MESNTLYEFYNKKGQELPSLQDRAPLYESHGLGSASEYTGTAEQNTFLLGKLKGDNKIITTGKQADREGKLYSADLQKTLDQYLPDTENKEDKQQMKTTQDVGSDGYSDSFTRLLDNQMKKGDRATQMMISQIQAKRQNRDNELRAESDSYKKGLQLLGVQGSGAQASPDILRGQVSQVERDLESELSRLDQEESMAIMEATQAQEEGDFRLLKEKMEYVKELKKEKQNALKNTYEKLNYEAKIGDIKAAEIYDALQTLSDENKEEFLLKISEQYGIPLGSLVAAVGREKSEREESELDIAKKRNSLDGSGSGGGYSAQEKRKLRQAGIDSTDIEASDDFLYGDGKDPFGKIKPKYEGETLKKMSNKRKRKLKEEGVSSSDISEVEKYLNDGYSLEQIAQATGMPNNIYKKFQKYIES